MHRLIAVLLACFITVCSVDSLQTFWVDSHQESFHHSALLSDVDGLLESLAARRNRKARELRYVCVLFAGVFSL